MPRLAACAYGLLCYVAFLAAFLYAIGFVGNLVVPKTIDSGPSDSPVRATAIDLVLLSLFALQHSVMARPAFKTWWTKMVPPVIERSTYVLASSLALALIFWQWRALPQLAWEVTHPTARAGVWIAFALGWGLVLVSTLLINHFDLFGLRQVYLFATNQPCPELGFQTPWLYRYVRHPIMLGFVIAFWAAPTMTFGHLLFAVVTTVYILVAIQLEERDLAAYHGEAYARYRQHVSMLLPLPKLPGRRD